MLGVVVTAALQLLECVPCLHNEPVLVLQKAQAYPTCQTQVQRASSRQPMATPLPQACARQPPQHLAARRRPAPHPWRRLPPWRRASRPQLPPRRQLRHRQTQLATRRLQQRARHPRKHVLPGRMSPSRHSCSRQPRCGCRRLSCSLRLGCLRVATGYLPWTRPGTQRQWTLLLLRRRRQRRRRVAALSVAAVLQPPVGTAHGSMLWVPRVITVGTAAALRSCPPPSVLLAETSAVQVGLCRALQPRLS